MFVSASWYSIQVEVNFSFSSSCIEAMSQPQQGLDTHKTWIENTVDNNMVFSSPNDSESVPSSSAYHETSLLHPPDFTNIDPLESVTYSSEDNVSLNSYADFTEYVDTDRVDKLFEDLDEYESFAHHVIL